MIIWSPDRDANVWTNETHLGDIGGTSQGVYGALWAASGSAIIGLGYYGDFLVWKQLDDGVGSSTRWTAFAGISGHFGSVNDLCWDSEYRYLVSTSTDQTTRVFAPWTREVESGETICSWLEVARPQVHGYDLQTVAMTGPFQLASGADGEKVIRVFDAPATFVQTLSNLSRYTFDTKSTENLPQVATLPALGLSNKSLMGDDAGIQQAVKSFDKPPLPLELHHFTLWPENDKLYGHGDSIYSLACSHDGMTIASSSVGRVGGRMEDTALRLWQRSNNGQFLPLQQPIVCHSLTIIDLKFNWSDTMLVSVGRDRAWTLFSRQIDGTFAIVKHLPKAHARIIWSISWTFDDRFFCTGSRD
eukprot:Partr_v1_DN28165_c2_g1_i2_m56049 putative elongator acetyltransferase complex subunit 2